jgi:uncharacterized protein
MMSCAALTRASGVGACLAVAVTLVGCSAASRLDASCVAGDIAACVRLGDMYAAGKGVPRDPARAERAYQRACDGGVADLCNTLGEIVERTGSIEGGMPRAEQLYQKACEGGSSAGCLNLGLAAAAREDKVRAFALYERSCQGGWAPGCHQVAVSYEQGDGVTKDVTKAIAFYSEACDGEDVESCEAVSTLYVAGEVVARDTAIATRFSGKAMQIYDESCRAGIEAACTERDRLRTRIAVIAAGQPSPPPAAIR